MRAGTGENGELTVIDIISVVSFMLGLVNLDENLSQSDKADLQNSLQDEMSKALAEIHEHLAVQDKKIDKLLSLVEEVKEGCR